MDLTVLFVFFSFRTYYIKKVPYSNLLFIAINETMPKTNKRFYTTLPRKIVYNDSMDYPCQKLDLNSLPRRRLAGCYNEHPLVILKKYKINLRIFFFFFSGK